MGTDENECLVALREAAERLGKSPTKAEYDRLNVLPASTTIVRHFGGWNEAKERANLRTFTQGENGGREIDSKPDGIEIPGSQDWKSLTSQQRWYYKNREHRIETKERRRRALHRWLYELKRDELSCSRCDEQRPPALDFHHPNKKRVSVSEMVNDGYARERIRTEIDRSLPLCANCHRKTHAAESAGRRNRTRSEIAQAIEEARGHGARDLRSIMREKRRVEWAAWSRSAMRSMRFERR